MQYVPMYNVHCMQVAYQRTDRIPAGPHPDGAIRELFTFPALFETVKNKGDRRTKLHWVELGKSLRCA